MIFKTMKLHFVSILPLLSLVLGSFSAVGQAMIGYTDAQGDFYVNDGGKLVHLESERIVSMQPSANSIAYIANNGNLIYYHNHEQKRLEVVNPGFYRNTDYYLFYATGGSFSVYDGENRKYLGYIAQNPFAFGDSIAAVHDYSQYFYVYEGNDFIELEQNPVKKVVAGDNIIAYVSHLDQFKIYYHGEKVDIDAYMPYKIEAGANIVGFIDSYNYLKIYYDKQIHEIYNVTQSTCLEIPGNSSDDGYDNYCNAELVFDIPSGLPLFKAGDDFVAYIDDMAQFMVFDKGNIIQLESQLPKEYHVTDNLLWYIDNNDFLKVYVNGELSVVETFAPNKILSDNNVLVYTDLDNRLKAFYYGNKVKVSENIILDFSINNTIVVYNEIPNKYKFYFLR